MKYSNFSNQVLTRYTAPGIEEIAKALVIIYYLRSRKIGFLVDSAIYGFAVGAGFAFIENIYYLYSLENPSLMLMIIRGFGTAVMHGGTTAIFSIVTKNLSDRYSSAGIAMYLPGLIISFIIHSAFNHFILPPHLSTIIILVVLPALLLITFDRSEKSTENWLGISMDSDIELINIISNGQFRETKIGRYLETLKSKFPGQVVSDMLCLIRLYVELAMRSKGILLTRKAGLKIPKDPEIEEKFAELAYLEKNIGRTGKLAILPFIHSSGRELWQIHMLKD